MSRRASLNTGISQPHSGDKPYFFPLLMNSGRLPLIFAIALFLTFLLASGNVTAEMLFQSPQSPPEQPPAEQPPAEQPPAEQPPAEQPPAEQPPAEQPPGEPSITQEPLPQEPLQPVETGDETFPEDEEVPSDLVLDEAELIDSIIVSGASVWLCCGIILLLLVPLSLLLLYIRGRSKIAQEEDF
ncbi:hypothetical protein ACFLXQ_02795 [Chloroflexota bacterium]